MPRVWAIFLREALVRRSRSLWRVTALTGCLFLVVACSDGYPTEDVPLLSPAEMSMKQLLTAMNRMVDKPRFEPSWHYTMATACVLEVTAGSAGQDRESVAVPLDAAGFHMRQDTTDKTYVIELRPADGTQMQSLSVLEGGKWVDAVQMRSLLLHLQRGCYNAAGTATG